jgi:hypothetical protein
VVSKHNDCLYHVTPAQNLAAIAAEGLVPKLGERSERAGETEPWVHCFTSFQRVENAFAYGLERQFDEGERLAILCIGLRPPADIRQYSCSYNVTLGPHLLWVLSDDISLVQALAELRDRECVKIHEYMADRASEPVPEGPM